MIIVGEKINATRSDIRPIIENRKDRELSDLAREQADAGASTIDVNIATGKGSQQDEIDAMRWAVGVLNAAVDKTLCIDSADPDVLAAGLEAREGRPAMINSVKAEEANLTAVLPLAARFEAPLVALAMDPSGIPKTADKRVEACRTIAESCRRHDVSLQSVFFDPLVLPVVTDDRQGRVTLDTLRGIREALPEAKTIVGLSNVSYGLPGRSALNAAFFHMALYAGLDAVIMDPLDEALRRAVLTGEALVGKDRRFRRYTRSFRNPS